MPNLVCSHCRTDVPRGASVCTGCQAEVEYGSPGSLYVAALAAAAFVGFEASRVLPESMRLAGWGIVGVIAFAALCFAIEKACANRVVFKRIYRTRK